MSNLRDKIDKVLLDVHIETGRKDEYSRVVDTLVDALSIRWTTEKPTEPGWYWMKGQRGLVKGVYKLDEWGGELCVLKLPLPDTCSYAGPLPEPEDV